MKDIYFTITGTKYRYGHDFMKPGMKVKLVKEPDNPYDKEAIRVEMKNGLGLVGYVANSIHTVRGECVSAGRMYDRIGRKAKGTVKLVLPDGVICKLDKKETEACTVFSKAKAVQAIAICDTKRHKCRNEKPCAGKFSHSSCSRSSCSESDQLVKGKKL